MPTGYDVVEHGIKMMEAEHWAIAEKPERELIVKALAIAIAAMDADPRGLTAEADRMEKAKLLARLADESDLELYGQQAMALISRIADR